MNQLPLPQVHKIAVFRPNAVGDFVFALPALHALRGTYPQAEIVYLGLPWHATFLAGRPGPIDRVVTVPPARGLNLPEDDDDDPPAIEAFMAGMQGERFDVAMQVYGGGLFANPFVKRFKARLTIGLQAEGAQPLDRCIAYRDLQNRRLQILEVAALAGARALPLFHEPELCCAVRDHAEAGRVLPPGNGRPLVLMQPGARDPRRRWPPAFFAEVGDFLVGKGHQVAIHGSAQEGPIVRDVIQRMKRPAIDLSGRVSLSGLCGLLARAQLLVSNDTGPLHLALALGTPAVGVYWLTNLVESAPLRQDHHRPLMSLRTHCPVCHEENITRRCPHDDSFVGDVSIGEVIHAAEDLLSAHPAPEPAPWPVRSAAPHPL